MFFASRCVYFLFLYNKYIFLDYFVFVITCWIVATTMKGNNNDESKNTMVKAFAPFGMIYNVAKKMD